MLHIVDFDDTVFFTSEILRKVYRDTAKKLYGKKFVKDVDIFSEEDWEWARSQPRGFVEPILTKHNLLYSIETLKEEKRKIYPYNYYEDIKVNVPFLQQLFSKNRMPWDKFIICTNSEEQVVRNILGFYKLQNFFDDIVGRNTFLFTECKPSTSMFKSIVGNSLNADILKIDPRITMYDDSDFGLESCRNFKKEMEKLPTKISIQIQDVNDCVV